MSELTEMQKEYLQQLKEEEAKELADNADLIHSFKLFCLTQGIELNDEVVKQHLHPTDKNYFEPTPQWNEKRSHDRIFS